MFFETRCNNSLTIHTVARQILQNPITSLCLLHGNKKIETILHVLLHCKFYRDIGSLSILPLICKFSGRPENFYVKHLLEDLKPFITCAVNFVLPQSKYGIRGCRNGHFCLIYHLGLMYASYFIFI